MTVEPAMTVLSLGERRAVVDACADAGPSMPWTLLPPDVAIWADTGSDPPEVAVMVAWLAATVAYEVVVVRAQVDILHGLTDGTDGKGNMVGAPVPTFTAQGRRVRLASRYGSAPTSRSSRPIRQEIRRSVSGSNPGGVSPRAPPSRCTSGSVATRSAA